MFWVGGHTGVVGELTGGGNERMLWSVREVCLGLGLVDGGVGGEVSARIWGGQYMIARRA